MSNKLFLLGWISLLTLAAAGIAQAEDIPMNTARMQAMDKITGKVTEIDVPVGGLANFGSFSIMARKCVASSPEETPEDTAFIDVVDNYESDNPVNIFKGWMFSSTPALNAVEHPIYDVWLLKCYNNKHSDKYILLNEEQLSLRDGLPMRRPEAVKVSIGELSGTATYDVSEDNQEESSVEKTPQDKIIEGESLSDDDFASEGEEDFAPDITIEETNTQPQN